MIRRTSLRAGFRVRARDRDSTPGAEALRQHSGSQVTATPFDEL